ncbi:hypothetical protein ACFW9D_11785 [Streptomyces sp. NPDC059524]|uniref:hypothetical protein n=1 Tax=Streptomyces sp. NPDC059524 TaxID=3346856 RepID=UPI00368B334E
MSRGRAFVWVVVPLGVAWLVVRWMWLTQAVDTVWNGEPYPVADPAVTASRIDERTQDVYDALALPDAGLDRAWPGRAVEAYGSSCRPRGLRHFSDQLADSPPSADGVVTVHSEWALTGVSPADAAAGLRRVEKRLEPRGWEVVEYDHDGTRPFMRLRPPGGGDEDQIQIQSYPRDRLQVAAYSSCARYPEGTPLTSYGEPALPAQQAPAQLRD